MLQEFTLFGILKVLITCPQTYTCPPPPSSPHPVFDETQFAVWCIRAELQTGLTLSELINWLVGWIRKVMQDGLSLYLNFKCVLELLMFHLLHVMGWHSSQCWVKEPQIWKQCLPNNWNIVHMDLKPKYSHVHHYWGSKKSTTSLVVKNNEICIFFFFFFCLLCSFVFLCIDCLLIRSIHWLLTKFSSLSRLSQP